MIALAVFACGGTEADVSARAVFERYLEEAGIPEAGISTRRVSGAFELAPFGVEEQLRIHGSFSHHADRTPRVYLEITTSFGEVRRGDTGELSWEIQTVPPARETVIEDPERHVRLRIGMYQRWSLMDRDWLRAQYSTFELARSSGPDDEGRISVRATPRVGLPEVLHFDELSGQLVGLDLTSASGSPIRITLEDYRDVEGVVIPFSISEREEPQDSFFFVTEVTHGAPLPEAAFSVPVRARAVVR